MKRIIFCMAATAMIAACGGQDDAADATMEEAEPVPVATADDYLGSWSVSYPDGRRGVTTNNDDGTYVSELEDGTVSNGTWTFGEDQTCWTPDEGEGGGCYEVSAPQFDNSRVLTAEDGSVLIVAPLAEGEAPAAEEATEES